MKKKITLLCAIGFTVIAHHNLESWYRSTLKLSPYRQYLEDGTNEGQDWSYFGRKPKSRYHTFRRAFEEFEKMNGSVVVELGTTCSFVHGGLEGCLSNDLRYWTPDRPERWDWGAGSFTRMAAECLSHLRPNITIHTVDLSQNHIYRCKVVTKDFEDIMLYHVTRSETFLSQFQGQIDLLYLDTGDINEAAAKLHLKEAIIIVDRDLVKQGGLVLIDDVRHSTPKRLYNEKSDLGKAKYSLPYFLANGFELVEDEFQVLLRKK